MTSTAKPSGPLTVDLSVGRYDQTTYIGRLRHFLDVTDVRTLFTTKKQLEEALENLEQYEVGVFTGSEEELWQSKKIKDAIVHPQLNTEIPLPFRMSAFVPANIFICAGLLIPNPSTLAIIFWQWVNQSYNIAVNHANRNASNDMSHQQVFNAYSLSVITSCSVALGLNKMVQHSSAFPQILGTAIRSSAMFIPYTAVATASILNVLLMRFNEIKHGIDVEDESGKVLGRSKIAGKSAIAQVAFSRAVIALPALTVPPLAMKLLDKTFLLRKLPRLRLPVNLALIGISLQTALPAAIAVFPQRCKVEATSLEPEFHNLRSPEGAPITSVYYNKGL